MRQRRFRREGSIPEPFGFSEELSQGQSEGGGQACFVHFDFVDMTGLALAAFPGRLESGLDVVRLGGYR